MGESGFLGPSDRGPSDRDPLDRDVLLLFALVSQALASSTEALLSGDREGAGRVVAMDKSVDALTTEVSGRIWEELDLLAGENGRLKRLVVVLSVLSELERSADLAEHIAQRGLSDIGPDMSAVSRGIVQRMSDVALEMWREAAHGYLGPGPVASELDEADEELDILLGRLTAEVAASAMPVPVAAQVTLLGRFYERLGDHAVNLARRIERLASTGRDDG
ncbi:MAG: hypothetical protein M1435_02260 [Actinobacteria bacterium]|nr:hypothetical protein [Actinomycetota bacterium]